MPAPAATVGVLLFVGAGCGRGSEAASRGTDRPPSQAVDQSLPAGLTDGPFTIDTVASGLEIPWALAFAPDGRVFVTERPGRVRVIDHGVLRTEPWATLPVTAEGEGGLMGIALAPDFASSHFVYVVATSGTGSTLQNRVLRLVDRNGSGADPQVIVSGIPAAEFHDGDAIAFGPDGMLYVATGDAREPSRAQDPGSLGGKILRYTPDGRIPSDNPTPGSPVYAMGLRNVQGLAWDPQTRQLFATEHGPSGFPNERFRRDRDELNAIRAGANYGWPSVAGGSDDARFIPPLTDWTPGIAPSGLAVYSGTAMPAWRGNLFVGALRGEQLRRVVVERDASRRNGWRVAGQERFFSEDRPRPHVGRIRAVAMAPDGHLWFTTSNRDGRGAVHPGDDHIFRLVPGQEH